MNDQRRSEEPSPRHRRLAAAVQGTLAGGWFVAGWPSGAEARAATLTTSDAGTLSEQLGTLSDGTTVQSTVAGGWFVAWWPSAAHARSATVTSSDLGSTGEQLGN
jgi:hypothetical protein